MNASELLFAIVERLSDPTAVLEYDGTVICANTRFNAIYNPLNDPKKKTPCSELMQLSRKMKDSGRPMLFERMILGPVQKVFDVFIYALDGTGGSGRRSFVLVKEQTEAEMGELKLEVSDELVNSFTSAWRVFSQELDPAFDMIKGKDLTLRMALLNAQKAAMTSLPILIVGESGTGKELLAAAIHRLSQRNEGPFVEVNCAAIPESLIESELFGYEKGAFTGARKEGKKGLFDQADGGTIFLDEIGDASFSVQSKLLRVLQSGQFMRVGGTTNVSINVRVISATNQALISAVQEARFRDDLYYRLNTVTISLPPLRNRESDIRLLAECFLEEHSKKKGQTLYFSEQALRIIESFAWPGNIRELKGVVDYAATMSEQPEIGPENLPHSMFLQPPVLYTEKNVSGLLDSTAVSHGFLATVVHDIEKRLIQKAISVTDTRSEAIRLLGISRRTFYKKIKQYGLDDE